MSKGWLKMANQPTNSEPRPIVDRDKPAGLTPEMLSEEDRASLWRIRLAIDYSYADVYASDEKYLADMAFLDRLLGSDAKADAEPGANP